MNRIYVRINPQGIRSEDAQAMIDRLRATPAGEGLRMRDYAFEESEGPLDGPADVYTVSVPADSEDEAVASIVGLLGLARVVPQDETDQDTLWRVQTATEGLGEEAGPEALG